MEGLHEFEDPEWDDWELPYPTLKYFAIAVVIAALAGAGGVIGLVVLLFGGSDAK